MSKLDDRQAAPRIVRHSDELLQAVRDRIHELETTYASVEAVSGIQSGYLTKVIADPPPKRISLFSAFLLLSAIGLQIELTVAPDFAERIAHRLEKRRLVRKPGRITGRIKKNAPDFYAYISRLGNDAGTRKLSPQRRSELARNAARTRWMKAS